MNLKLNLEIKFLINHKKHLNHLNNISQIVINEAIEDLKQISFLSLLMDLKCTPLTLISIGSWLLLNI